MKRIAWLTDIHLNFLLPQQLETFLESVVEARADALLISGDIAEAPDVCDYLAFMRKRIAAPIYFVLGNHDYYHGSIVKVRQRVTSFCSTQPGIEYLTRSNVVRLTPHVALVGHDGWADGRAGNYASSLVSMMDYRLIDELIGLRKQARWEALKSLGDEAAAHIRRVLPLAFAEVRDAVLLTHVPPLRDACWHEGRTSDDEWAPHFTCQAMGDAILEIMSRLPDRRLTVLCGHTHGYGECQPLANVQIITGGAEYGFPGVQRVLEID